MNENEIRDRIAKLESQAEQAWEEAAQLRAQLPSSNNEMSSRNAYLIKGDDVVGIHAVYYPVDPTTGANLWQQLEIWGNNYDKNLKMIGGSFRIFDDFDVVVSVFKSEGYEDYYSSAEDWG